MRWKNSIGGLVAPLIALLLAVSPALFGQQKGASALFKAGFLNHEMQSYVGELTDYELAKGDTAWLEKLSFKADAYVVDSTTAGYVMRWCFHDFAISSDSRLLYRLVLTAKPVTVTCSVSPVGVLQEFLHWESLSTCLDEGFRELLPEYALRSDSAAQKEIQRSYALRSNIEGSLLRVIRLFHQLHGYGYTVGEVVEVPAELDIAGVSEKVSGIIRKELVQLDEKGGIAAVSMVSLPDPAVLKRALEKTYHPGTVPPKMLEQKIAGSTVFDLKTGWVLLTFEQLERGSDKDQLGQRLELRHESVNYNQ